MSGWNRTTNFLRGSLPDKSIFSFPNLNNDFLIFRIIYGFTRSILDRVLVEHLSNLLTNNL